MEPASPLVMRGNDEDESSLRQNAQDRPSRVKGDSRFFNGQVVSSDQPQNTEPPPFKAVRDDEDSAAYELKVQLSAIKHEHEADERSSPPKIEPQHRKRDRDADETNSETIKRSQSPPLKDKHNGDNRDHQPPPAKRAKKPRKNRNLPTRRICVHCFHPGHLWTHCWQECRHCHSKSHAATIAVPPVGDATQCPVLNQSFPQSHDLGSSDESLYGRMARYIAGV